MATVAQVLANQANAQLSTGPRTIDGKARTAQNARKHGFTAATLHVSDDQRQEFETLQAGLIADTRPEGALENEIFRRLLIHAWNLRRIESFESQLIAETDPMAAGDDSNANKLDRFARYRRDLERSFYRALAELKKLQTQRAALLQQNCSVVNIVYKTTPLAELTRLTKQTDPFIKEEDLFAPQEFHASRKTAVRALFTALRKQPQEPQDEPAAACGPIG
ncbi:MAG: hypothetical protein HY858_10445 [Candidatus Solibacter usitatus]|nr:hypothetical protein [Candidatus Solibacter usitatus]